MRSTGDVSTTADATLQLRHLIRERYTHIRAASVVKREVVDLEPRRQ